MSEQTIIDYWAEKANEDLASAQENFLAGRFLFHYSVLITQDSEPQVSPC
jgi:hypothetical protein